MLLPGAVFCFGLKTCSILCFYPFNCVLLPSVFSRAKTLDPLPRKDLFHLERRLLTTQRTPRCPIRNSGHPNAVECSFLRFALARVAFRISKDDHDLENSPRPRYVRPWLLFLVIVTRADASPSKKPVRQDNSRTVILKNQPSN